MIGLRLIGFAIGTWWLASTTLQFLKGRRSAVDMILFGSCAAGLVFLSINPDLLNQILVPLSFTPGRYGRIIGLLLIGFAFLFFLHLRQLDGLRETDHELTRLIRRLALREFQSEHPEGVKGPIAVLIPALNEGASLGDVLGRIPKKAGGLACETIVIDDGSTDDTARVARSSGAKVVSHAMNRGGGAALATGYELARANRLPYVVTIDADGQYRPEEIPAVLEPVLKGEADLVAGSRLLGHYEGFGDPRLLPRTAGLFFFNAAASLLLCRRVTDIPSGFRAIRTELLDGMTLRQKQFHTSEFLIEAIRNGARFKEVPVRFMKRRIGESKKPATLRYGWGYFKALFGTWWR